MKFSGPAAIKHKIIHSPKIFSIDITCPEIAHQAIAGQFVQIKISGGQNSPWPRPFSVFRVSRETITIYIKRAGKITDCLANMNEGESLYLTGPLGNGFQLPPKNRPVVLVAGGVGLPPLYFLCDSMITSGHQPSLIHLYSGAKTASELFSSKELKALGIGYTTATEDGSNSHKGLITEPFANEIDIRDNPIIYGCGPMGMLKEVARIAAGRECYLSLEQLMPCGWGVCNGCAVKIKVKDDIRTEDNRDYRLARVCKEGPVFDANEVLWE